jgi:hypothetical protein
MPRTCRADVLDKQAQAVNILRAGNSYEKIAQSPGYANRGSAWRLVNKAMRKPWSPRSRSTVLLNLLASMSCNPATGLLPPVVLTGQRRSSANHRSAHPAAWSRRH